VGKETCGSDDARKICSTLRHVRRPVHLWVSDGFRVVDIVCMTGIAFTCLHVTIGIITEQ